MSVVKSGPPDQIAFGPGAFLFAAGPMLFLNLEELQMDRKELAYAKQALLGIKDWDAFQAVIRTWSRVMKAASPAARWVICDKKGR